MGVPVACACGKTFDLSSEYAGQRVTCPACAAELEVPAIRDQADGVFARDKFLLCQKRLAINEKYAVHDEQDRPVLFVERPTYLFRSILAALGVLVVLIVGVVGALLVYTVADNGGKADSPLAALLCLLAAAAAIGLTFVAAVAFFPKRHVSFYRSKDRTGRVLQVLQDSKLQLVKATFTVLDANGQPIARLSKNILTNILRKCWMCTTPDGSPICCAYEDSIILALLRRFLGPMFGLLRTNFVFVEGMSPGGRVLGEFNRKFTIFDRYALDLSPDATRSLDRRIALALGLMLDTGERR